MTTDTTCPNCHRTIPMQSTTSEWVRTMIRNRARWRMTPPTNKRER